MVRADRRIKVGGALGACVLAMTAMGVGTVTAAGSAPVGTGPAATTVVDDTGLLTVDVPAEWTDVSTLPALADDGTSVPQIVASTDQVTFLGAVLGTFGAPGVSYSAFPFDGDSATALAGHFDFSAWCTDGGVTPYQDGYFVGSTRTWSGCSGTETRLVTLWASPFDSGFSAALIVELPTAADDTALSVVLDSFYVVAPTSTYLADDTGQLSMSVPVGWTDVTTAPSVGATGATQPTLLAASDLSAFWTVPGASFVGAPFTADPTPLVQPGALDAGLFTSCTPAVPVAYDDGTFTGIRQDFSDCASGLAVTAVAANRADRSTLTALVTVVWGPADASALDIVLNTFNVLDPGAGPPVTTVAAAPATTIATAVPTPSATTTVVAAATTVPTATTAATGTTTPASATATTATAAAVATTAPPGLDRQVVDDWGLLTMSVPSAWTYVQTAPIDNTNSPGLSYSSIVAAERPEFVDQYGVTGLYFKAFPLEPDLNAVLAYNAPSCAPGRIVPFDNGYFSGVRQDFTGCGGTDTVVMVSANSPDSRFTAFASLYVKQGDDAIIEPLLASLRATDATPIYHVVDETGLVAMDVPAWWPNWNNAQRAADEDTGPVPQIWASDGTEANDNYVYFDAFPYADPQTLVPVNDHSDICTAGGTTDHDDGVFVGVQLTWNDCNGVAGAQIVQVFAAPADKAFVAAIYISVNQPDDAAVAAILGSFNLAPEPDDQ